MSLSAWQEEFADVHPPKKKESVEIGSMTSSNSVSDGQPLDGYHRFKFSINIGSESCENVVDRLRPTLANGSYFSQTCEYYRTQ